MLRYLITVGGPTFAILYQGWRAWDFMCWWRPVQARTISSDYSDAERLEDTGPFAWLKPRPWSDSRGDRRTKVRIEFADDRGVRHDVQVTRMIHRGRRVMSEMTVFFDSRDPNKVDVFGATGAITMVVFWGLLLTYILFRMAKAG